MDELINWDDIPEILSMEQFRKICHISKQTARFLLNKKRVPCQKTGKKTRCYRIKKKDVMKYLINREETPERYSATAGWYGNKKSRSVGLSKQLSAEALGKLHDYYAELLSKEPDVLTAKAISNLTGYSVSTINKWCNRNRIPHFHKARGNFIPKIFLIDFFCSEEFRMVSKKTEWHAHTMKAFERELRKDL